MRPLALAAIVAVLAGCSVPYVDQSFKASEAPGTHSDTGTSVSKQHGEAGHEVGNGEHGESAVRPDEHDTASPGVGDPTYGTSSVFPNTAQPTGKVPEKSDPAPAIIDHKEHEGH